MADPLFDPLGAHKRLEDAFRAKEQSQGRLKSTLLDVQQDVTVINRDYAGDLNTFATQTDRINEGAMEALGNLETIDSNPAIVNRVMSLFDSKYSRNTQERKLQRAQYETARLANQMKTKDDMRQMKLQEAGQELQLAEQLYQFDQQGFLDQAQLLQLGFQVEAQINQRILDTAQNASLDQIKVWRDDPSKAPKSLQDKPGLLETVFYQKASEAQGYTDAKQIARLREFQIQQLSQDQILGGLDDEMLSEALRTGKLPEGLPHNIAQDEWERRQQVDYALRSAAQAAATGDIQLELNSKQFALSKMKTEQINLLLRQANSSRDGAISMPDGKGGMLRFTQQELEDAHDAAYNRDLARTKSRNDALISLAGVEGNYDRLVTSVENVAALANPGTGTYTRDPVDSLPANLRSDVKTLQQQINYASQLPGGGYAVIELQGQLQAKLDEWAEAEIKGKPSDQQPAYREFYQQGVINDPQASANYMEQALPNQATLAHDLVYGPIWEQFSDAYLEIAGQDTTTLDVGAGGGGLTISKTDKPNNVDVLEKAARKVRGNAQGVLFQSYAAETVLRLQQQFQAQMDPNHRRDGLNIWSDIVNPNTLQFDESVRDPVSGAFDLGRFSQYLAAKTNVLRAKGVLKPGESLNQILENTMRGNSYAYAAEISAGSIEKAGVNNTLFGNNVPFYINQAVNDFGAYTNTTLAVARERSTAIEQQIKGLTAWANDPFASEVGSQLLEQNRSKGLTAHEPGDDLLIEFMRGSQPGGSR